jgi:hypothetical protein
MLALHELVDIFSSLRPSSTFLSVREYNNNSNELANFLISFHINYNTALQNSLVMAENYEATTKLEQQAKNEVVASIRKSIDNYKTPIEEKEDGYERFLDFDNNYVKGIKLHIETQTLHIYGFVVSKEVIRPGTYKVVNSSVLTKAKDVIRKDLPISKFRQFALRENNFTSIRVNRINIENK